MSLKVLLRCSDQEFEKLISLMDLEVSYFKGTRRLTTQPSTPATRSTPYIEGGDYVIHCHLTSLFYPQHSLVHPHLHFFPWGFGLFCVFWGVWLLMSWRTAVVILLTHVFSNVCFGSWGNSAAFRCTTWLYVP